MVQYAMIIDLNKCVGCHACAVACKAEWEVPADQGRNWVKRLGPSKTEFGLAYTYYPGLCNHCDQPACDGFPIANEANNNQSVTLQNALFVNDTLRNIQFSSSPPTDRLVLNQTSAFVTPSTQVQTQDPILQNELLINQTLQNLNIESATDEELNRTARQSLNPQNPARITPETQTIGTPNLLATQGLPNFIDGTFLTFESSVDTGNIVQPVPLAEVIVPEISTRFTEDLPGTQGVNPASLPFLLNPSITPFVIAAYEIRAPGMIQGDPAPVKREVQPITPIEAIRHIDRLVVSSEQERGNTQKSRDHIQSSPPPPIETIKYLLKKANEDLASRGSPLHLVFAQNHTGLMLDIYDCSFPGLCSLQHDVSLELGNLSTVLNNLAHETGLIIDSVL